MIVQIVDIDGIELEPEYGFKMLLARAIVQMETNLSLTSEEPYAVPIYLGLLQMDLKLLCDKYRDLTGIQFIIS